MIDFVAQRRAANFTEQRLSNTPLSTPVPSGINVGDTYIPRDKRQREARIVSPAEVIGVGQVFVRLRHPTRTTSVRLDRFREHYVKVDGNVNNG